jgi:hypothetical protein
MKYGSGTLVECYDRTFCHKSAPPTEGWGTSGAFQMSRKERWEILIVDNASDLDSEFRLIVRSLTTHAEAKSSC